MSHVDYVMNDDVIFDSENNGDTDWPAGCSLQYVSGDKLTNQTQIPVTPLSAGSQTDGES